MHADAPLHYSPDAHAARHRLRTLSSHMAGRQQFTTPAAPPCRRPRFIAAASRPLTPLAERVQRLPRHALPPRFLLSAAIRTFFLLPAIDRCFATTPMSAILSVVH